ncbi:hypothetical protein HELRODRAFT_81526, partial [Helobdella robusta]|uniref:UDP-glucuronosyltransferase n=1 Tax=Helobdella robusta TaxID=6412 RepID=T1G4F3_HELRO
NTLILDWLPQNDVLGHPSTKLFITHCGNNGIHEALYHGVPMLGFPLFAEQGENCRRMIAFEFGIKMDIFTFTEAELVENVLEILTNPKYKSSIKQMSKVFKDQPMAPLQKALFWMEHVIKHGGSHLRSSAIDLPLYQFLCFDTIAVLLLIITIVTFAVFQVSKFSLLYFYEVDHHFNSFIPNFPNHISVAGLTCSPAQNLPKNILDFINGRIVDGKDPGVILMSFGSFVDYMPNRLIEKFFKVFESLNETILVRYKIKQNDTQPKPTIPTNVMISDWLPQNDLLGHPSTKLFITHCGNNGQHEALYHGVPMLGFPLFAEQDENARKVIALQFGLIMDIMTFTEKELFGWFISVF